MRLTASIVVVALAAAATGLLLASAGGADRSVPVPDSTQQADLLRETRTFAAANGDSQPTAIDVWATTRKEAFATLSDAEMLLEDEPVYVVRASGVFVGHKAPRPAGVAPPRGRFLTLVFDADTYEIRDWYLDDEAKSLSGLGAPTSLLP